MFSTFRSMLVMAAFLASFWAVADNSQAQKVAYKSLIAQNSQDVMKIKLGMNKDEALSVMKNIYAEVNNGPVFNPWKIESFDNKEIYFYITSHHPPFTPIRERQATPIVFENGQVAGIGVQYYSQLKRNPMQSSEVVMPDAAQNAAPSFSENKEDDKTIEERLLKLKKLYDAGLIDKAAYDAQQMRILDSL